MTTYRIYISVDPPPGSLRLGIDIPPSNVNTRLSGLAAARPSAPNAVSCFYLATDSGVVTESDGAVWSTRSRPMKKADFTGIMTGLAAARPGNGAALGWLYYATDSGAFSEGFPTGWATLYFQASPGVATVPSGFGPNTVDSWEVTDYQDLGTGVQSTGDAAVTDVMSGKTFSSALLNDATGTLATRTLSAANDTVTAGYYAATTLHAVDADLATGNIKAGITIFGIAGTTSVVDTASGDAVAADIATGKKAWVNGVEITGVA